MTAHLFIILVLNFLIKSVSCNDSELTQFKNEMLGYIEDLKQKNEKLETTVSHLKVGKFLNGFV